MALNSDSHATPAEVLETVGLVLRRSGSDQLKLRVVLMVLESYFSGRPVNMDALKAKTAGSDKLG